MPSMEASCRAFAVIPAAGYSLRMGRPKLLLPWGRGTLIEQTLIAWRQCAVSSIVIVVRPDDEELAAVCKRAGADVVIPLLAPPHMRDSVQLALDHLADVCHPSGNDVWLLAPADMPFLSPAIVAELLAAHRPDEPAILFPTLDGHKGHPVLFPWPLARQIRHLPADRGIDALHGQNATRPVPCDHLGVAVEIFQDVDTPAEYDQARQRLRPDR